MNNIKFSPLEAFRYAWDTVRNNLRLILIAALVVALPSLLLHFLNLVFKIQSVVLSIISQVIGLWLFLGFIRLGINLYQNKSARISDLFSEYRSLVKYIITSIFNSLIIFGGFLLLVIPGIIFAVRFSLFPYFIVDKRSGVIESLKLSWRTTRGYFWKLLVLAFLSMVIVFVGFFAFGIGLLIAVPMIIMAYIYTYKTLSGEIREIDKQNESQELEKPENKASEGNVQNFEGVSGITSQETNEPDNSNL